MICSVLLFGITGCGTNKETVNNNEGTKKEEKKKDIVMTCTIHGTPENEYEPISTVTEIYTYDENMILKKIEFITDYEYANEERANSQKSIHQGAVDRANNEFEGVSGTMETKSSTRFVYTFTYDIEEINDLEGFFGKEEDYFNYSTHKFDPNKLNEEVHKGTCTIE